MVMHDIPDPPPEYDDELWYCCVVECYFDESAITDCTQDYVGMFKCCKTGAEIKAWHAAESECKNNHGLCGEMGWAAQRLRYAAGPHAIAQDCMEACDVAEENGTSYGIERARAAYILAHDYNLMPIDPGSFSINQVSIENYNYIIAARKDASSCLVSFNMDELEEE